MNSFYWKIGLGCLGVATATATANNVRAWPVEPDPHPSWQAGKKAFSRHTFTRKEVQKHNSQEDIYITYRTGVYDVTKFLDEHPGNASRIMLATMGNHDISGWWKQLGYHNNSEVHEMLERFRVGDLIEEDVVDTDVLSPPVDEELRKNRKALFDHAISYEPFIAETPVAVLANHEYTPVEYHYVELLPLVSPSLSQEFFCFCCVLLSISKKE